jgi:hypothetical protein
VEARDISVPQRQDRPRGAANLLSNGYRGALSPKIKRPGREADHSPPSSAEVKMVELYLDVHIRLHGVVLN